MERVETQNKRFYPLLVFSVFLFIASLSSSNSAAAAASPQLAGTQLAYFVGTHAYYGTHYRNRGVYYRPNRGYYGYGYRHRSPYWSGWRYAGHGCRKQCLLDWRGYVIRCNTRCR